MDFRGSSETKLWHREKLGTSAVHFYLQPSPMGALRFAPELRTAGETVACEEVPASDIERTEPSQAMKVNDDQRSSLQLRALRPRRTHALWVQWQRAS
jgi:hypothetical protein